MRTRCRAAHHVYEGSVKEYLAVDISENMLNLADALIKRNAGEPGRTHTLRNAERTRVCRVTAAKDADGEHHQPLIPGVRTQRFLGQAKDVRCGPSRPLPFPSFRPTR